MVEYVCPKCKKIMTRMDAYVIHINRKNSCIIEERLSKKDKLKELEDKIEQLTILVKTQGEQIIMLQNNSLNIKEENIKISKIK